MFILMIMSVYHISLLNMFVKHENICLRNGRISNSLSCDDRVQKSSIHCYNQFHMFSKNIGSKWNISSLYPSYPLQLEAFFLIVSVEYIVNNQEQIIVHLIKFSCLIIKLYFTAQVNYMAEIFLRFTVQFDIYNNTLIIVFEVRKFDEPILDDTC